MVNKFLSCSRLTDEHASGNDSDSNRVQGQEGWMGDAHHRHVGMVTRENSSLFYIQIRESSDIRKRELHFLDNTQFICSKSRKLKGKQD